MTHMLVRSIRSFTLLATLTLAGPGLAQGVATNDEPADFAVTLGALENMNTAAASKLQDALQHQKVLEGYVASANLGDACGTPSSNNKHDMAMSFEQALKIAVDHEQAAPTSSLPTNATSGEVRAYTTLTRSTWDKLQTAMANVQHLSDCLHSKGKLDDFNTWSTSQDKAHHEAMVAKQKEVAAAGQKKEAEDQAKSADQYATWQAKQKAQHAAYLKHAWTRYKFDTNANLKAYKYEKQYGPNSYNQTYAGNQYGDGGGYSGGYGGGYY
ncbi:MAG: hypothetical protein HOO04_10245 [Phycisphaerae bacterium]|nr:hypothetical protein [Phycisphaerae bacterium]